MSAAVVFMAVTFMSRVGAAFRPRISSSVGQRSAAGEGGVIAVVALALPAASAAPLPLAFAFAGPVGGVFAFALPFAPGVAVGVGLALCFAALGSCSLGPRWLSEVLASGEIAAGCCALGAATSVVFGDAGRVGRDVGRDGVPLVTRGGDGERVRRLEGEPLSLAADRPLAGHDVCGVEADRTDVPLALRTLGRGASASRCTPLVLGGGGFGAAAVAFRRLGRTATRPGAPHASFLSGHTLSGCCGSRDKGLGRAAEAWGEAIRSGRLRHAELEASSHVRSAALLPCLSPRAGCTFLLDGGDLSRGGEVVRLVVKQAVEVVDAVVHAVVRLGQFWLAAHRETCVRGPVL